jgi:hypothetical protein
VISGEMAVLCYSCHDCRAQNPTGAFDPHPDGTQGFCDQLSDDDVLRQDYPARGELRRDSCIATFRRMFTALP